MGSVLRGSESPPLGGRVKMSRPSVLERVAGPMNLFPFVPAFRRFVDEFIGRTSVRVKFSCWPAGAQEPAKAAGRTQPSGRELPPVSGLRRLSSGKVALAAGSGFPDRDAEAAFAGLVPALLTHGTVSQPTLSPRFACAHRPNESATGTGLRSCWPGEMFAGQATDFHRQMASHLPGQLHTQL